MFLFPNSSSSALGGDFIVVRVVRIVVTSRFPIFGAALFASALPRRKVGAKNINDFLFSLRSHTLFCAFYVNFAASGSRVKISATLGESSESRDTKDGALPDSMAQEASAINPP